MYYIVGLGNPGEEYIDTRHNTGRIAVEAFAKSAGFPEFVMNKKAVGFISAGELSTEKGVKPKITEKITAILPETFMNKSGASVSPFIGVVGTGKTANKANMKKAEKLIVVHDDLDMPLGKIKILFNRGAGGHRGIESISRAIKTDAYVRIKIGISPATPKGTIKKPDSDSVLDFIIGKFKKPELEVLKGVSKTVAEAIKTIVLQGREKAMGEFNRG
jgi:PTH1 family peptidyl-tRNA hydrolase